MISSSNSVRIAWLLPTAWFYWQPSLSELTQKFSLTKVFTGLWPGFAKGFENALDVQTVGNRKVVSVSADAKGYGNNFTYLSPNIVFPLLQLRPHVVFSSSFGVWTLLALMLKPIGGWRVVIAYEGSSPSVDFRSSKRRLALRRAMVRAADACITNSQQGKAYLTEVLNAPDNAVFAFPYEVPDPRSLLAASVQKTDEPLLPFEARSPVFICIGSIIPRKGLTCLLQACQQLNAQGITDYTVLVVGDGEQRPELEQFCRDNDLTEQVRWLGRIPYEKLGQYIQLADVFVLPTLEDTWGMVVLETMILGKPVLCSTGAGASELVKDGQNGYRFEPENAAQLSGLMQNFVDRPEIIPEMGQQSQQIMEQHTPEKAGKFLADIANFVLFPTSEQTTVSKSHSQRERGIG